MFSRRWRETGLLTNGSRGEGERGGSGIEKYSRGRG
jgi:hypothetical protein